METPLSDITSSDCFRRKILGLRVPLYLPGNRDDIGEILAGKKLGELSTVFICLEDAIRQDEVGIAEEKLVAAIRSHSQPTVKIYIRVRSARMLQRLCRRITPDMVAGFVLPKCDSTNLRSYLAERALTEYEIMPTLETRDALDPAKMTEMRSCILDSIHPKQLPCLRVGGNDLMKLMGIRRPKGRTAYETPLGTIIDQLIGIFHPYDIPLAAPVYNQLNDPGGLQREAMLDSERGLGCKAAIHPAQLIPISKAYQVNATEIDTSLQTLKPDAKAVFQYDQEMQEPSTQTRWAKWIKAREDNFGVKSNT